VYLIEFSITPIIDYLNSDIRTVLDTSDIVREADGETEVTLSVDSEERHSKLLVPGGIIEIIECLRILESGYDHAGYRVLCVMSGICEAVLMNGATCQSIWGAQK